MAVEGGPKSERETTNEREPEGADALPLVTEVFHTAELPLTPRRDARMPAHLWAEAPTWLIELGEDIAQPIVAYKRNIHGWALWRAGPARGGHARYGALDPSAPNDTSKRYFFRLFPDGVGEGIGPDGAVHERFRTWKQALRDAPITHPESTDGPVA